MGFMKKRIFLFTLLGAVSVFFILEGNLLKNPNTLLESDNSFIILARAINLIRSEYVEEPAPGKTMEGAFKGLVNSLDIRSSYLDEKSKEKFKRLNGTPAYETGLVLYKTYNSFPVVIGIKENSPAEKQGIELGESIGTINGMSTLEMSMIEADLSQKSEKADSITIKILRRTKDEEITLKRERVNPTLYSFEPEKGPGGILKVHVLFPPAVKEIKKNVIPQISTANSPLIIDLRCCHEGTLEEAWGLINIFMQKKDIGYMETKGNKKQAVNCLETALLPEIPLLLWTNQATIGASEAAAFVLQKYRDATVIGMKTPGLMSDEKLISLNDGTGIVLTTGIFHPFSKAESWNQGINPDITRKKTDLSLKAYLEASLKSLSKT